MATIPQREIQPDEEEDFDGAFEAAKLPGHTVDALLEQGKVDEARDELELLLFEGANSGPGIPMTEALFDKIVAQARSRAGRAQR